MDVEAASGNVSGSKITAVSVNGMPARQSAEGFYWFLRGICSNDPLEILVRSEADTAAVAIMDAFPGAAAQVVQPLTDVHAGSPVVLSLPAELASINYHSVRRGSVGSGNRTTLDDLRRATTSGDAVSFVLPGDATGMLAISIVGVLPSRATVASCGGFAGCVVEGSTDFSGRFSSRYQLQRRDDGRVVASTGKPRSGCIQAGGQ